MKIIIVHYRFFISGGPERYLFNIIDVLKKYGHDVIPFSIKHKKNVTTKYEQFFPSAIGNGDETYGYEYKKNFSTLSKVLSRMLYSLEVKRKMKTLIKEEKPDLIYVLQFQNKMSASVIDAAHSLKIPIVQRISDFAHICSANTFYRNDTNSICELCLHNGKFNGVVHKCVYNSYSSSIIKFVALKIQDFRKTLEKINLLVIPSRFTALKYIQYGVNPQKIECVPTFFKNDSCCDEQVSYGDFALYIGRVEKEKGLMTLIKAFENSPRKLIIIGSSSSGYEKSLLQYIKDKTHNIEFLGNLEFDQIKNYLKDCLFTICPSECYDNFPNTVLESFAFKKMVIASRMGSLMEMVDEKSGMLFEVGNSEELKNCCEAAFNNRDLTLKRGLNAYLKIKSEFSEEQHYSKLIAAFNSLVREPNQ